MAFKFLEKFFKTKEEKKENHDNIGNQITCLECNKATPGYCCGICFRWYCKEHLKDHQCIHTRKKKGEKCSYCKKKYDDTGGFYCMYCNDWFCQKHHDPKKHKCKHPLHRKK